MADFTITYSGPETPSANGHRFVFRGSVFPHRRMAPVTIAYHRKRVISYLEAQGVQLPITGKVHIAIEVEPSSTHCYDLDNVIGAMFQMLDGSTLTHAGKVLESDAQIVDVEACEIGHSLLGDFEKLETEVIALRNETEVCVQDRLSEINAEAEAYDRDASNTLAQICEELPGFSWTDHPEGLETTGAYEMITEHIAALTPKGFDPAAEGSVLHGIATAIVEGRPISPEENQQLKTYALAYTYGEHREKDEDNAQTADAKRKEPQG
jgi:Holliday junction resolvase RusA-like endonuclease